MNILWYSRHGDSYGLAQKVAKQHEIFFFIEEKKYRNHGKGIDVPNRIDHYEPYIDKADLVVFDMSGKGALADSLRKRGKLVIGAGEIADNLEDDRAYAMEVVKKYCKDVTVAEYHEFPNIKSGIAFLEKQDEPYVFKPKEMPTNWTFVPRKDDNSAVISVMKACPKQNVNLVLQKKLNAEDYVEISTEQWFDGEAFVEGTANHTMEHKRFLAGEWGPNVGCAGSVVWACGEDKLVNALLHPLAPLLKKSGYVGPVDANAMVNEEHICFLEFSLRFGYDAVQNLSLLTDDFGRFLYDIAAKQPAQLDDGLSFSVRLSYPPYPASEDDDKEAKASEGLRIVDVPEELDDFVMLVDVMKNDEGEMVLAGMSNVIGTVHAIGDTVEECQDMVYDDGIIDAIALTSDIQFRNDIGKGMEEEMDELREWGWIDEN